MSSKVRGMGRKLRVCVVLPKHWSTTKGGAEFQAEQIAENLVGSGRAEVFFLAKNFAIGGASAGYRCVEVACRLPTRAAKGTLLDVFRLFWTLARIRPDVIYQRVGCAYTGVCGLYAKLTGCRFVWHVAHDYDVTPGRFAGAGRKILLAVEKKILESGISNATEVVTQTRFQCELLERSYRPKSVLVIPNFHPIPPEPLDSLRVSEILWVSNLKPLKRPQIFVDLAVALEDLPDVRFVMIGRPSWDERWQQSFEAEVARHGNLCYAGEYSQEEVNDRLGRSMLLVSTSKAEGFPNTFIQAWMRGVPVVSLGADPDGILSVGELGFHAESVEDLISMVRRLINEPKLRHRLGANARRIAVSRYGPANLELVSRVVLG
ncbi:glycosyltransferase family 4 protein [Thiocapsa roseopersicina]|uniref:Glycosyltransferase involved in cell wall bisynthesis n=1 Tax=Thiocapsa roseopersicina TaxID=1058 RepID=A0A1H2Y5L4_THIRO|nr:glycosyltransferase family 4 protein [Thiocapsa roseopersicina]SDW99869.1 Glycosyltransferase involved in cell wall bisynthesis [Thiocapsa roseopersicina]